VVILEDKPIKNLINENVLSKAISTDMVIHEGPLKYSNYALSLFYLHT